MTLLPEVAERDAPPKIAAIYDEMRRFTRLPLVNLIYRHLATIPGALPWAWGLLRPAFADGSLEAAAGRVQAGDGELSGVNLPRGRAVTLSALHCHPEIARPFRSSSSQFRLRIRSTERVP